MNASKPEYEPYPRILPDPGWSEQTDPLLYSHAEYSNCQTNLINKGCLTIHKFKDKNKYISYSKL